MEPGDSETASLFGSLFEIVDVTAGFSSLLEKKGIYYGFVRCEDLLTGNKYNFYHLYQYHTDIEVNYCASELCMRMAYYFSDALIDVWKVKATDRHFVVEDRSTK